MNNSDPFIKNIKQTLDQQPLDQNIQQQLNQARQEALNPSPLSPVTLFSRYAKPVVAFASLAVIAIALVLNIQPATPELDTDNIEAFEMLSNSDALELYENQEFYLWLDEEMKS